MTTGNLAAPHGAPVLVRRAITALALAGALTFALSACSPASTDDAAPDSQSSDEAQSSTDAGGSGDSAGAGGASGQMWGCTQSLLDFVRASGYPEAVAIDPATVDFVGATVKTAPDCATEDPTGGYDRQTAIWVNDPAGALTAFDADLKSSGYTELAAGAGVWLLGGDDPTTAEHSIGAGLIDMNGTQALWATWSPERN